MKCSTKSIREIRGFSFLVPNCDSTLLREKFESFRKLSNEENKTYIIRIADSNYFKFEVLMLPKSITLLTISTVRGTNNINLRDFEMVDELQTLACCAYQKEELKTATSNFLSPTAQIAEAEVVDLISTDEEFECQTECNNISWNEIKLPESTEGKWTTTELASTGKLYLKALSGQAKFLTISTERPQNSIKFTSMERLGALCCFLTELKRKLNECPALKEVLQPYLQVEIGRKRRKR
ncbi:conserved hypothetical protein [Sulfolobus islandicus Y.G.57.14]|jgi:hypothetical protein|uniref:Uncharacterized protein n=2 Tax=Saccharolobus islandicus TaxID=43080 RepID=C3N7T3_SACI7|nr:hypothetical protein [Sulfolobus islandicus]ACP44301.1 conserved hypothetical protein [Sulfolobus islandicus Y.G.57.14]ACP47206.1 conserved hypothetical protein [Sulfolobus islandicus Y.N.15.51]PVU77935.1 hypothetical protein DDW12_04870 [Sulfolobus islandicus]